MARGARAPPAAPDPGPGRLRAAARVAAGTRCGSRDPAGGGKRGSWRGQEGARKQSEASRTPPKFSQLRPLRWQASCCSARPPPRRRRVAERKGTGRGRGRRKREREREPESPATSVKTWGGGSGGGGGRGGEEGREGARGREEQSRGQLFPPVSSAGCAGRDWGSLQASRVSRPMGPSSRNGCMRGGERSGASSFPLLPRVNQIRTVTQGSESQKGSDYTIPETDAGVARAGGSGQGQRHRHRRRRRTLALAPPRRPDPPSPRAQRPPAPHWRLRRRGPLRPARPLALARAARGRAEPRAALPAPGTRVYGKFGDLTAAAAAGTSHPKFFVSGPPHREPPPAPRPAPLGRVPTGGAGETENGCQSSPDFGSRR